MTTITTRSRFQKTITPTLCHSLDHVLLPFKRFFPLGVVSPCFHLERQSNDIFSLEDMRSSWAARVVVGGTGLCQVSLLFCSFVFAVGFPCSSFFSACFAESFL